MIRPVQAGAVLVAYCLFSPGLCFTCAATLEESFWEVKKSNHFAAYYKESESADYVNDVLNRAEKYYEDITEQLGFRRFEFWTWEKQCKIYMYSSAKDYYDSTAQPAWSGAAAYVRERTIRTFVRREEFLETILPHEMAHLIFREFVGYRTYIPLWLDEGIASLQEEKDRSSHLATAAVLVRSNVFIPLPTLTKITKDTLVVPAIFYTEAASVIEFLLRKYGKEKFVDYCRYLRDNKNWEKGLETIYGFKDMSDMNDKWVEFLFREKIVSR